eukprot:7566516-Ditylum_brightwellii.AAC.1
MMKLYGTNYYVTHLLMSYMMWQNPMKAHRGGQKCKMMTGQDMGPEFKKNMGHFFSGMKWTVAKARAKNGASLDKGKKYTTYA